MTGFYLSFELPGLPKQTNSNKGSWFLKAREAKKWKRAVKDILLSVPKTPLKKAKLTLVRLSAKEPDFDGLVSGFKHVIDGLVEAGVLENDKSSNIGQPTYLWQYTSPKSGRIKITVEAM